MGVKTKNTLLLQRVFLLVVDALILEAGLLVQMLMTRRCLLDELRLCFYHVFWELALLNVESNCRLTAALPLVFLRLTIFFVALGTWFY